MSITEIFTLAESTLLEVIREIKPEQWSMKMPSTFAANLDPGATLRDVINYHTFDEAWVPEVLAGKTVAEVGSKYAGDLLGDDPAGAYAKYLDKAKTAISQIKDLKQTVHLSYGDFSAEEYLTHITYFRGMRAYDLANLIGVSTQLPDALVVGLWQTLAPQAEEWRQLGVFGPAVNVSDQAPLQDKLLGLTGRQPE